MNPFPHGHFLGDLNRSVKAGGFTVDLRVASLPPEAVAEHSHDTAHFILPLADRYRSLARDPLAPARTLFGAGSAIYNPPGVVHRDCFDVAGGLFLSVSAPADLPAGLSHPALLRGEAERAMRRLVGLGLRAAPGDELAVEQASLTLAGAAVLSLEASRHAPDWLMRAVAMVEDLACAPGLEIRAIADEAGVHPVYLARSWRRHLGRSPASAIRHRRADQATQSLARNMDLAEAAAGAGYADQSHMTREYARIFGVTPGVFRAALAGKV